MRFTLVFICFFILYVFYGQAPDFQWVRSLPTDGYCWISSTVTDQEGNIYSTGAFEEALIYELNGVVDTFISHGQNSDAFIEKRNEDGELVWIKQIGGQYYDGGQSIAIDDYGHIAVYGSFSSDIDINPGPEVDSLHVAYGTNRFILKLEADNGDFVWAKHIVGPIYNYNHKNIIEFDKDGNLYHTGVFNGNFDINPSPTDSFILSSEYEWDVFIQKLDSNGNFVWGKQIEVYSSGISSEPSSCIDINSNNEIVLVGTFEDTIDFDLGIGTDYVIYNNDNPGLYMVKMSSNGDLIWAKSIEGQGSFLRCPNVKIDDNDDIVLHGYFNDTVDFDPGIGVEEGYSTNINNGSGVFVLKLDDNGEFNWVEAIGGTATGDGMGLDVDNYGNIYTTCTFYFDIELSTVYGDIDMTPNGGADVLFTKLDGDGNMLWGESFGGQYYESVSEILVDPSGFGLYITGAFSDLVDFDFGLDSFLVEGYGQGDAYILKINTCNTASIDEYDQCEPLTWIDGITYNTTTNFEVTHTITNANGCDSTIYLNLTLPILDTNLSVMGVDLVSHQSGGTYQWLDCYQDYEEILGANSINYAPQLDGSYAVEVTYGNCTIISECYEIQWFSTGEESVEELKLYSNPLEDHITINLGKVLDKASIRVYNILGKEILQTFCLGEESKLLFIPEAKGVYFVDVNIGGANRQFKLLKY